VPDMSSAGGEPRSLWIVPSRGRPGRLAGMLDTALQLSSGIADFAVCTDDDDPDAAGYEALRGRVPDGRVLWFTGRRRSMCAWTNYAAAHPRACRYSALGSMGDDHLPATRGWDLILAAALASPGTGIAYGDDLHQRENLATAPLISRRITDALGWMCLPGLASKFCDNVWMVLGRGAGCLAYVPRVTIEHVHPDAGKTAMNGTYTRGYADYPGDEHVYRLWCGHGPGDEHSAAAADIRTVRGALARCRPVPP
jgi:hypothetical protein